MNTPTKRLRAATLLAVLCAGADAAWAADGRTPVDPMRARLERMSDADLKDGYLRCANAAEMRRLDGCEIAVCSVGRDVLLQKAFAGDFDSLLAWSKTQHPSASKQSGAGIPLCEH